MQTFLPLPNFTKSAKCLDRKRLGKQRVETIQLLNALLHGSKWSNHPAAKMWKGYETQLCHYGLEICLEWKKRGYKDTCAGKILDILFGGILGDWSNLYMPPWLGKDDFHASHRAALLAKDFAWYSQFGWKEEPKIEYVWPV